ncbi:MAG: hypothetical protein R3B40_28295 [Polyangiales bacterium]
MACAVWVVGFEAGPLVHTGLHELLGEHSHGGGAGHHGHGHAAPGFLTQRERVPLAHTAATHAHTHGHVTHAHGAGAAGGDPMGEGTRVVHFAARHQRPSFAGWRSHGDVESARDTARKVAPPRDLYAQRDASDRADDDGVGLRAQADESPLEHGQGSLAHRDLAALHTLPTLPPVPEAPFAGYVARTTHRGRWLGQSPTDTRARAPPTETAPHLT